MRLFVAVEIPNQIKDFLATLLSLKLSFNGVNIVQKENFHITLKFLGEVEDKIIPNIKETLKSLANEFSPFTLKITRPGLFPDKSKPRVIWMGTENTYTLRTIADKIDEKLSSFGFQREQREFKSHITLARVKNYQSGRYLFEKIADKYRERIQNEKTFEFYVREFVLMKSTLTPKGSIYEVLERFELKRI